MLVTGDDFTLQDLALEDTKGDALKVNGVKNTVIRRVRAEWTGGGKTSNGAYGLYPVQVTNVLIEGSVVKGASDAGIYVGQSTNIVVRDNRAEGNVAGIEIENSTGADVYGNTATGNTGGILVFNMPNLPVPGSKTRVFKNKVTAQQPRQFRRGGQRGQLGPAGVGDHRQFERSGRDFRQRYRRQPDRERHHIELLFDRVRHQEGRRRGL